MGTSLYGLTPAATYQGLIKFGDNSAISASLRYLSDGLGNDLPISVASSNVGINTTTGSALLNIKGTGTTNTTSPLTILNSANTQLFKVLDNGVSFGTSLNLGSNNTTLTQGSIQAFSALGNNATYKPESFATDSSGFTFDVSSGIGGPIVTYSYLGYGSINKNWLIGGASNTARLSVKGSGSTSATTTLLVQNNTGTNSIQTTDDGKSLLTANISNDAPLVVNNSYGWAGSYVARCQTWLSAGSEVARIMANGSMILQANITATTFKATQNIPSDVSFGGNGSGNGMYMPASNVTAIATAATERMRVTANGNMLIKTTAEDTSALLKMDSTTQGMLPPRMTDAQVRAIVTPAIGLTCYNTDLDCPVFYSAAGWRRISHSAM